MPELLDVAKLRWRVDAFCPLCRRRVGFRLHVTQADAERFGSVDVIVQSCPTHGRVGCRPVWTIEPAVRLRLIRGGSRTGS